MLLFNSLQRVRGKWEIKIKKAVIQEKIVVLFRRKRKIQNKIKTRRKKKGRPKAGGKRERG